MNDCLYAPCDGVIIHVARTGHALTIRAENGAEVLMHVGIDTVELNGEGFALLVKDGARVSKGQALVQFDLDRIARQCKSLVSLIILTNGERFELRAVAGQRSRSASRCCRSWRVRRQRFKPLWITRKLTSAPAYASRIVAVCTRVRQR